MTPDAITLEQPQRQSLWAVAFLALRTLREVGLIQLTLAVGFLLARLPSLLTFAALVAVLGVVMFAVAALQWWRYTFHVRDDELVVERGVVSRQTLTIPLDRVQSVSLEQKLLHRLVSLVQIELETAGASTAEFVIHAVDHDVASALQRTVANFRATTPSVGDETVVSMPPAPEQTVLQHPWQRVVAIALTQTPFAGLVLVGPLLAMGEEIGDRLPFDLPELGDRSAGSWLYWFVPALLVAGLAISIILNLLRVLLTEWNLTVTATAAGLRRNAGLFATTSVATTIPRIQIVGMRQGLLQRFAGLQTVSLQTIGVNKMVVPGCDVHQAGDLRSLALDGSPGVERCECTVSPADIFLQTRNAAVFAVALAVGAWFLVQWWSMLALVMVPVVWLIVRRSVRLRRWGASVDAIASHHELVGWRRRELLVRKVNGVTVRQSLFERKRGLATVVLATASGSVSIGMISLAEANELRDTTLFRVETDRRSWM